MSAVPNDLIAPAGVSLERAAQLTRVVDGLDPSSLLWLSGYAAGLAAQRGLAPQAGLVAAQPAAATTSRLTIIYGWAAAILPASRWVLAARRGAWTRRTMYCKTSAQPRKNSLLPCASASAKPSSAGWPKASKPP